LAVLAISNCFSSLRPIIATGQKGLQKCGYATDRAYANKLIKIIEDYELYTYDKKRFVRPKSDSKNKSVTSSAPMRPVYLNQNKQLYIIAKANDSFDAIAQEFDIRASKLRKYNEVPNDYPLQEGDVVYLQKKAKKASSQYHYHTVEVGESMHSISQLYGIRMKYLYKMNHKDSEYVPAEGDLLKVR
jgi:LysM domain./Mannosyl-glycoprotein endo-beta-N-acetylglucosaminidase.